ncbi:MAG: hypothetical protein U5K30_07080 [Acidimicrobiales bacterium]|nr:hypothetical protein [Acidimicrobiales bacterium]
MSDTENEFDPGGLTSAQQEGLEARRTDRDATIDAVHRLEEALSAAAPGRETAWRDDVLDALATLDEAMATEYENASRPESLLSDIKRTQPRLRTRVRGVRMQYQQLQEAIRTLREELAPTDDEHRPEFSDIRQRLAWLLTALRHQRARESDLIYEAYFDAFATDLDEDR